MPVLFLGNVDNEQLIGDLSRLDQEARFRDAVIASRMMWFAGPDDAFLLPYQPSATFIDYVCELLDLSRVPRIVVPGDVEHGAAILNHETLSDDALLRQLAVVVGAGVGWRLEPYYADRSAAWLAERLGLGLTGGHAFYREGGAEILNSKVAFRRIAAGAGVPLAPGRVCSSADMLAEALSDYTGMTGMVIVKRDLDAGGEGNALVIVGEAEPTPIGVNWVHRCADPTGLADIAALLWPKLTDERNNELVAEAYFPNARSYYTEFLVPADVGRPELLNFGEQRMEPNWCGFVIPSATISPYQVGQLATHSAHLAEAARSLGYRGRISFDAIPTPDGGVLFNEFNGRIGGPSHIDHLARRFFGDHYEHRVHLLTKNEVPADRLDRVLDGLRDDELLWRPGRDEGCLIMADGTDLVGIFEYLVVASTSQRAREIEARCAVVFAKTASGVCGAPG
jgi:hypothetical protein